MANNSSTPKGSPRVANRVQASAETIVSSRDAVDASVDGGTYRHTDMAHTDPLATATEPVDAEGNVVDLDDNGGYGQSGGYGEALTSSSGEAGENAASTIAGFAMPVIALLIIGIAIILYFTVL